MKKPSINSADEEAVNPAPIAEDPETILRLIDLIFLAQEEGRVIPS